MVLLCIFLKVQTIYLSYVSISFTLQKDKQPILPFVMFFIDVQKLLSPGFTLTLLRTQTFSAVNQICLMITGYFPIPQRKN